MIKSGLDAADALQKMSSRTGASVEALSVLRHAASLSDVTMSELERGLTRMQRSLGEAIEGTKSQADAFAALNIDVEKFRKLSPEQQFTTLAEQLSRVDDRAEMMAIGNDIFGRSFERLLPLIEGGADGLATMEEQARVTNQIMGKDGADAAARANDAMQSLTNTVQALSQAFAVELAPSIAGALEGLTERLPAIMGAVRASFLTVGRTIGAIGATAAALLRGDFRGASEIGNIKLGEIYQQALDESMPETARNTAEANTLLRDIRDAVREPQAAVAG
jgi:hypothetical protein